LRTSRHDAGLKENQAGQVRALMLADAATSEKAASIFAEAARLSHAMRRLIFVSL
jgi:hypothetical protein